MVKMVLIAIIKINYIFKKASKVIPVDTIGCGDSFMAGDHCSYLYNLNLDNILEEDTERYYLEEMNAVEELV